jgi:rubrerythrin
MGFVTLEEVIKFAVQREETAVQLYTEAAKKTTSIAARKMFEEFVVEEMGHKKVFSQMDLARAEQYKSSQVRDMGISKYLVDIELKPDMTYPEILQFAIKTEENAYQLYKAAAEGTDDPQLKKTLEVFADVELGHKKRIESIYDERVLTEN